MPEVGLERAVELVLADPYWNPRPLEREGFGRYSMTPGTVADPLIEPRCNHSPNTTPTGDKSTLFPRNPSLPFEDTCRIE